MVVTSEQHISSVLERISAFCNELKDTLSLTLSFADRVQGTILVSELYDLANCLNEQREEMLSSYFGENSLRYNLQRIVQIESIQHDINDTCLQSKQETLKVFSKRITDFYTNGHRSELLPIQDNIWGADDFCPNTKFRFKNIFHDAHENLSEPNKLENLSKDPYDAEYNKSIRQTVLERQFAHRINGEVIELKNEHFIGQLMKIYKAVDEIVVEDIITELYRGLEMLRSVFMREAQDIYYIRSGNFEDISTEDNKQEIDFFYTELPLHEYFEMRNSVREEIQETIDIEIEEWRISKGYTNRKLRQKEYLDFLQEQETIVHEHMKNGYPDLWKLREHSGGLNEGVTPENFARMFFKRKNVDRQFLELEWKYELISEMIAKAEQQKPNEQIPFSPEQATVKQFIDNLTNLAQVLYDEWNGKEVQTGVHQPLVKIVIQKQELVDYLDDLRTNHFEEIKEWCYPPTANNKQNFVKFVIKLREQGFFGKLPNNLIAPQLAPIVMLTVGTVTNYLSQKID